MPKSIVITVTGTDRPGILEKITEVLVAHKANVKESRMAHLGGEFAGIMLASAPEEAVKRIKADLERLEEKPPGLSVRIAEAHPPERSTAYKLHEVTVSGADHEGIVHGVASYLASHGANIEDLSTDIINAPISGAPLFSMHAVVAVPSSISTSALKETLRKIAEEQCVEITVNPME